MSRLLIFVGLLVTPLAAQQYKIAVIGMVHGHVWGHLGKMLTGGAVKLVGIAETQPELVAEANKRGAMAVPFYNDYRKMLDMAKPDIVWAFVENHRHLEIVEACAPRKIHVIFEKPLASTYSDAVQVRKLAREHGIQVMTNYQMAWWPANYAAKAEADSGAIGKVWRLHGIVGHGGPGGPSGLNRFFFEWLTDPVKNGGGALVDFGCYNALWSLWYLGRPETVFATANQLRPREFPKVEDTATLILHYKNGIGIFEGSWDLPRGFQDLEVFGLGGSLSVNGEGVELRKSGAAARQVALTPLPPERAEPIGYLANCLRTGRPLEGLVALDVNVEVCEILDAAKESIRTGKAVRLAPR